MMRDARNFLDPHVFNGFRFASTETLHRTTLRQPTTGEYQGSHRTQSRVRYTDVKDKWLIWGIGNTAWYWNHFSLRSWMTKY